MQSALDLAVTVPVSGILIGLVDINGGDGDTAPTSGLYLLAGAVLGFRHDGRASACWPPLEKASDPQKGTDVWFYSLGETSLDDYWRRWVYFTDGKVSYVVSDYWED